MAKKKEFDLGSLDFKEFTTIDGRNCLVQEYFEPDDFSVDKNGGIFVKEFSLITVAKKLFKFIEKEVHVEQSPETKNDMCAVVVVSYSVTCLDEEKDTNSWLQWSATADCHSGNSSGTFGSYTTAMAETRASARCLRVMLGLNICSAEEVSLDKKKTENYGLSGSNDPISKSQKSLIESKFIRDYGITLEQISDIVGKTIHKLSELTFDEAADLANKLNKSAEKLSKKNKKDK